MPSVPRRDRTVATEALPGVRVLTEAPASAFRVPGEALDISPIAKVVGEFAAREKDKADQLALLDADNQLAKLHTDLQLEASQRKGKDALGATADVEGKWKEGVGAIEKTLTNDRQRMAFFNRAGGRYQSLYESVERHTAAETERYDSEVTDTALKNRINDALVNYQDPQMVAKAALELKAIVKDHGKRQGWDPAVIEEKSAEQLSRLHAGVIGRFLKVGDDRAAKAYYEKAKGQILGEHQDNIDQALEEGSTLGEAQRRADAIVKTKGITRTEAYEMAKALDDPKLRRATIDQLDDEYSRQDRLRKDEHDKIVSMAAEYADKGQRTPASLLPQLTVGERRSLDAHRKSVLRGDLIETDQAAYYELQGMAIDPKRRDAFTKLNLITYRDKLSNSDFQEMARLQMAVRKKGDEAVRGFLTDRNIVDETITPLFPNAGKTGAQRNQAADDEFNQFRRSIDIDVAHAKEQRGGKELSSDDVQKIVDTHVIRRMFGKKEWRVSSKTGEPERSTMVGLSYDEQDRPRIAIDRIPRSEAEKLAGFLRRARLSVSASKLERLYAAEVMGVSDAKFSKIAREP